MLPFGVMLLFVAVLSLVAWRRADRQVALVTAVEPQSVQEILNRLKSMNQLFQKPRSAGAANNFVAVSGVIQCDSPLISEVA